MLRRVFFIVPNEQVQSKRYRWVLQLRQLDQDPIRYLSYLHQAAAIPYPLWSAIDSVTQYLYVLLMSVRNLPAVAGLREGRLQEDCRLDDSDSQPSSGPPAQGFAPG